jgi:hypothetical protein
VAAGHDEAPDAAALWEGVAVPSDRLRLLKIPPRLITDEQLIEAAKNVLAERRALGPERVDRLLRELRNRLGLSFKEISDLTGFPLSTVFGRTRADRTRG